MNMEEFETKLITEVEDHPNIYDKTRPDYKNKQRKADSWDAISKILGKSVFECQKKWTCLRDSFCKLFKTEQQIPSGSGRLGKIKWKHYHNLKFLSEFTRIPSTMSNYETSRLQESQPTESQPTEYQPTESQPTEYQPAESQLPEEQNTENDLFNQIIEIDDEFEEDTVIKPPAKKRRRPDKDVGDKILEAISSILN